jgi:hypothetical protein
MPSPRPTLPLRRIVPDGLPHEHSARGTCSRCKQRGPSSLVGILGLARRRLSSRPFLTSAETSRTRCPGIGEVRPYRALSLLLERTLAFRDANGVAVDANVDHLLEWRARTAALLSFTPLAPFYRISSPAYRFKSSANGSCTSHSGSSYRCSASFKRI